MLRNRETGCMKLHIVLVVLAPPAVRCPSTRGSRGRSWRGARTVALRVGSGVGVVEVIIKRGVELLFVLVMLRRTSRRM